MLKTDSNSFSLLSGVNFCANEIMELLDSSNKNTTSEAVEGLFLLQPGQFDTFNAKLGKDVIDSFTQSNRHSLQRESGVFVGSGTRLWNLGLFISLPVILNKSLTCLRNLIGTWQCSRQPEGKNLTCHLRGIFSSFSPPWLVINNVSLCLPPFFVPIVPGLILRQKRCCWQSYFYKIGTIHCCKALKCLLLILLQEIVVCSWRGVSSD